MRRTGVIPSMRWYLRYALSYRDLARDDGPAGTRGSITRRSTAGGSRYAPELDKRSRPHVNACNDSWKVEETSIKGKKTWMDRYRAVDSQGNTLEFLLSPRRDARAAKRFFSFVSPWGVSSLVCFFTDEETPCSFACLQRIHTPLKWTMVTALRLGTFPSMGSFFGKLFKIRAQSFQFLLETPFLVRQFLRTARKMSEP